MQHDKWQAAMLCVCPAAWSLPQCCWCDSSVPSPGINNLLTYLPAIAAAIVSLVDSGENVMEVEAAGNTPLHSAAYENWAEGVELLLQLGAKVNASNNAGGAGSM